MENSDIFINYGIRFNEVPIEITTIPDSIITHCNDPRQTIYNIGLRTWQDYYQAIKAQVDQLDRQVKKLNQQISQNQIDSTKIEEKVSEIFKPFDKIGKIEALYQALKNFNYDLFFPRQDFLKKNRSHQCIRAILAYMHNLRALIAAPAIMRWALSLNITWADDNGEMIGPYYIQDDFRLPPNKRNNADRSEISSEPSRKTQQKSDGTAANQEISDAWVETSDIPEWILHVTSIISGIGLACFTMLGLTVFKWREVDQGNPEERNPEEGPENVIPLNAVKNTDTSSDKKTEVSKVRALFESKIEEPSEPRPFKRLDSRPMRPIDRRNNLPHRTCQLGC